MRGKQEPGFPPSVSHDYPPCESPSEHHQLSITGSGCESHVGVEAGHPDLVVLDQDAAVESLKSSKSGLANLSARYLTVAGSDFSHTAEESRANLD